MLEGQEEGGASQEQGQHWEMLVSGMKMATAPVLYVEETRRLASKREEPQQRGAILQQGSHGVHFFWQS